MGRPRTIWDGLPGRSPRAWRETDVSGVPSLVATATRADLEVDPFPHLVIRHALPDDVCDRLIAEYPPLDTITGGGDVAANTRFDLQAKAVREAGVSPLWQEFIERQTSNEFA